MHYLKKITPEIKKINIDLFLTESEVFPNQRFIMECILPKKCITVLMWQNITFLFMYNKMFIQQLMMESESNSLSNNNDKTFTIFINIKNIFKEYFDEYQKTAFADDQNE